MRIVSPLAVGAIFSLCAGSATAVPGESAEAMRPSVPGLSVNVPTAVSLGSAAPGQSISAHLGHVKVTHAGGGSWTATVTAGGFTTGAGSPAETITTDYVAYWSGPAVQTTGTGTFTPGQPTAAQAQKLNSARTAGTHTNGSAGHSTTWDPTLVITLPTTAVAGTYTGTVTHSVA